MTSLPRPQRAIVAGILVAAMLGLGSAPRLAAQAPAPSSDAIQKARDENERQKAAYQSEKARVDHINARVKAYKDLMAKIPFEPVPNTSNMVQVFMNGHDLRGVARQIYDVSDDASDAGFQSKYWPSVLWLNRAKDYPDGMPQYGKLDPQYSENNVALFPNVRKQGYKAIVAPILNADSIMAAQMTVPVVMAFRKRLDDSVNQLAARSGDVTVLDGPASMPGVNKVALFQGLPSEPLVQYPPRRVTGPQQFVSTDPVPVDREVPLDPSPPAWQLRQGVNMLGPNYQGYNLNYQPNKFDLAPEFAPIGMMGGRDFNGTPRLQLGFHFGLNQRFFTILRVNEAAFVAFSSAGAPSMNGGSVNAGLGYVLGPVDLSAMIGYMGVNVVGGVEFGPAYTGKLRYPITQHLETIALYKYTTISRYQVEDEAGGHNGVSNAQYFGVGVIVR